MQLQRLSITQCCDPSRNDTFVVPFVDDCTVGLLKELLAKRENDSRPSSLVKKSDIRVFFGSNEVRDNEQSVNYWSFLDHRAWFTTNDSFESNRKRKAYTKKLETSEGKFQIHVKTLDAKFPTKTYTVAPLTSVGELKEAFKVFAGVPLDQMRLIFAGIQLEDDRTMLSYKISRDSTLHFIMRLRGGDAGLFVDVERQDAMKAIAWSQDAPSWRRAGPGFAIEGKCTNSNCKANGEMVISNLGFSTFDLRNCKDLGKVKCPMCEGAVIPKTCAFNNCSWRYTGRKTGADVTLVKDWEAVGNAYHRFDEYVAGSVIWERLVFEAKQNCEVCSICTAKASSDETKLGCGHQFHASCVKMWFDTCKAKSRPQSCPMCRHVGSVVAVC
eukprot:Selendium_serpulae@DN5853_c4_g5_i4.p1